MIRSSGAAQSGVGNIPGTGRGTAGSVLVRSSRPVDGEPRVVSVGDSDSVADLTGGVEHHWPTATVKPTAVDARLDDALDQQPAAAEHGSGSVLSK